MHDIFPNEVTQYFLSHLSLEQLVAVSRVSSIWRQLGLTCLKEMIKADFPYLATEEVLTTITFSEGVALLKKQHDVYNELARAHYFPSNFLQRNKLKELLNEIHTKNENEFFEHQVSLFEAFAIASGLNIAEINNPQSSDVFLLMAQIGNLQMLKKWYEEKRGKDKLKNEGKIEARALAFAAKYGHSSYVEYLLQVAGETILSSDIASALRNAAENGHLACVKNLMNTNKGDIAEGWAVERAANGGHLDCLMYLIKNSKKEIPPFSKIAALNLASRQGHLDCIQHLIEKYSEISIEDKTIAYQTALKRGHASCAEYLDAHLKSLPLISPNANSVTFAFDQKNNSESAQKRKQEEGGDHSKNMKKRKGNK